MEKNWMIALLLFLVITFIVWKLFNGFYKKEISKKLRNTWSVRMYHWHGIVMISGLITSLIVYFLKSKDILFS